MAKNLTMTRRLSTGLGLGLALLMLSVAPALATGGFVFTGNYVQVGVDSSGGLIDVNGTVGLKLDCAGGGNFGVSDYLLTPGAPLEFYSLGIGGTYQEAGYLSGNNFLAATTQGDARLSTQTFFLYNTLAVNQSLYIQQNGDAVRFSIWGINFGDAVLSDVVYARGLDPDPDANLYGYYETINTINANTVRALGGYTGLYVEIVDLSGGGVPSVDANWQTDPYELLNPHHDGDGDYTINMAWNLGDLAPGQIFEIEFAYVLGDPPPLYGPLSGPQPTPLPAGWLLMGSGLAGLAALRRRRRQR